jgi:GH25 family lysozyme M1 (1,4-beta-N-acetylmuramidase)
MILEGYDVSYHNGFDIPWEKVAFGCVRLSHGKGADTKAPEHLRRVRAADCLPVAYHYLRGDSPGFEQADFFWNLVQDYGGASSFGLAVDLEHLNAPAAPWDRAVYRYRYLDFLKRIRDLAGRTCLTYSYRHFLEWLDLTAAEVGDSPLWLSDISGEAQVPKPWGDWTVHQYSYGPNNTLDHNRFRGSRDDFRRALGLGPSQADMQLGVVADNVRRASGMVDGQYVNVEEGPVIE